MNGSALADVNAPHTANAPNVVTTDRLREARKRDRIRACGVIAMFLGTSRGPASTHLEGVTWGELAMVAKAAKPQRFDRKVETRS